MKDLIVFTAGIATAIAGFKAYEKKADIITFFINVSNAINENTIPLIAGAGFAAFQYCTQSYNPYLLEYTTLCIAGCNVITQSVAPFIKEGLGISSFGKLTSTLASSALGLFGAAFTFKHFNQIVVNEFANNMGLNDTSSFVAAFVGLYTGSMVGAKLVPMLFSKDSSNAKSK